MAVYDLWLGFARELCAGRFSTRSQNAVDGSMPLLWSLCSLKIPLWPLSNQPLPNYSCNNGAENIILKCR